MFVKLWPSPLNNLLNFNLTQQKWTTNNKSIKPELKIDLNKIEPWWHHWWNCEHVLNLKQKSSTWTWKEELQQFKNNHFFIISSNQVWHHRLGSHSVVSAIDRGHDHVASVAIVKTRSIWTVWRRVRIHLRLTHFWTLSIYTQLIS